MIVKKKITGIITFEKEYNLEDKYLDAYADIDEYIDINCILFDEVINACAKELINIEFDTTGVDTEIIQCSV